EAIKFFGIKDLKEVKIVLRTYTLLAQSTSKFSERLSHLKPLILTQRISVIDESQPQKIQASICNKIEIKLCSTIEYDVEDKSYSVGEYEFIHYSDHSYFLKVKPNDTIEGLLRNSSFTDSVADILS